MSFGHGTDIWIVPDTASSKTWEIRAVKLELLRKVHEIIVALLCDSGSSALRCVHGKGVQLNCNPLLVRSTAELPGQRDKAFVMHGCQVPRPCCRCV